MAVELDGGQVCGEGFDVDGSRSASIEGVSGDCPGLGEIEVSCSSPDFLIAGKEDTDWTVRYIGSFDQVVGHFHDRGHAGFIVGTQECFAIGDHEGLADERGEFWGMGKFDFVSVGKRDIASGVRFDDLGFAVISWGFWGGVQMCVQEDGRDRSGAGRRDGPPDEPVDVLFGIFDPHGAQLLDEQLAQEPLTSTARVVLGVGICGGPDLYILQESVEQAFAVDVHRGPHLAWNRGILSHFDRLC